MKANEDGAECSLGSATWWLWPMPMPMPMPSKKILILYSEMYNKVIKLTLCDN
jgi:hypothetical protein